MVEPPQQQPQPNEPARLTPAPRWRLADRELELERPLIVGVVNATPDSFSDSGSDRSPRAARRRVAEQLDAGADVIEVGGESNVSNRPAVGAAEEIERVQPVVNAAREAGATVSIDTYKPAVAAAALEAGAEIVNDISGLADTEMVELCATRRPGVVLMHTITPPKVPLWNDGAYGDDVPGAVMAWFEGRIAELAAAGVETDAIALDPGVDFGKTPAQSVAVMQGFERFASLERPLMSAVSRKDFVGALTGRRPSERLAGTLAAVGWAMTAGARLVRAHDVAATRDYLTVLRALRGELDVPPELRIDERIRRERPAASRAAG
jgi:dihydropteroate synthase